MKCPVCSNKLMVLTTAQQKGRMLRISKCNYCGHKFASEEITYPITSDKGQWLKQEINHLNYEVPHIKINSNWIIVLNVKPKTVKLLG